VLRWLAVGAVDRSDWRARTALGAVGILAAWLALAGAGLFGGAPPAAASTPCPAPASSTSADTEYAGPVYAGTLSPPLAKPPATVGLTQTIYWNPEPESYWDNDVNPANSNGTPTPWPHAGGYAYIVNITNESTCKTASFHVPGGKAASQFTVSTSDFPAAPGAIDGTVFAYRLSTVETICQPTPNAPSGFLLGVCEQPSTNYSNESAAVVSLQAATAPVLQSLTLNSGIPYTDQVTVPVQLSAVDRPPANGGAAAGLGSMELSLSPAFSCGPVAGFACASAYAPGTTVSLDPRFTLGGSPPPDGLRTVCARVFDAAYLPSYKPSSGIGAAAGSLQPQGNVSNVLCSSILLDTTGPVIKVTADALPATAGKAVTFDATQSSDPSPGSGVDAGTAVWRFGDGTDASGLAVTHTYASAGSFTATFSLSDRAGNTSTLAIAVTVKPAGVASSGTTVTSTGQPSHHPPVAPARLTHLRVRRLHGRYVLQLRMSAAARVLVEVQRRSPLPLALVQKFVRHARRGNNSFTLAPLRHHSSERVEVTIASNAANATTTHSVNITVP